MSPFDHQAAKRLLAKHLAQAEKQVVEGTSPPIPEVLKDSFAAIFESSTQAYREALIGCLLARLQDMQADIRLPYVGQGPRAFHGRDIDEKVVNPFLHEKRIPSSRGPYLSVFRRSVRFDQATAAGLRDKQGYAAFLELIAAAENGRHQREIEKLLSYAMYKFAELREISNISLSQIRRISLDQCDLLIDGLLNTPSGGRFPVLLVMSALNAIKSCFELDWGIECQGINVADRAAGCGGDITIRSGDKIVLAAEVTERVVDKSRVVATFNTKIAPSAIEDYLFFVKERNEEEGLGAQVRQYFSQGHEVNFIEIKNWIVITLATLGSKGRTAFCEELLGGLSAQDVPKAMKMAWNEQVQKITTPVN